MGPLASHPQVISYAGNVLNEEYLVYVASPEWTARKLAYYKTHPRKCRACGETRGIIHLHHKTYERLGSERDSDFTVLCEKCHKSVHEAHRRSRAAGKCRTLMSVTDRFTNTPKEPRPGGQPFKRLNAFSEKAQRQNRETRKERLAREARTLALMQKHLRAIQSLMRRT